MIDTYTTSNELEKLINDLLRIDRTKLRNLQMVLKEMEKERNYLAHNQKKTLPGASDSEKQQLIGTLPFVLLNKEYFPNNDALIAFAKNALDVKVPGGPKKSRNDIIGNIIAEVANKDRNQINMFTDVLNKIIKKEKKGPIKNFFLEWDKVIRET